MAEVPDTERQAGPPEAGEVLNVSQLNDWIASVIEDAPALDGVHCIGEVTDLHQNSTALYFTLTDGDAELPCMIGRVNFGVSCAGRRGLEATILLFVARHS